MASSAHAQIHVYSTGDVLLNQLLNFYPNSNSPVTVELYNINANANRVIITTPAFKGHSPQMGCLIIPPADNTREIYLVPNDVSIPALSGIKLHKTNPCLLSLDSTAIGFFLEVNPPAPVGSALAGFFRICWF